MAKKSWSGVGWNIAASEYWKPEKAIAVCGAVSATRGLLHWTQRVKAYKTPDIISFLTDLSKKITDPSRTIVVLDNASIHDNDEVKTHAEHLNMQLVYTVPYQPWENGIEEVWANVKREFKGLALQIKTSTDDIKPTLT